MDIGDLLKQSLKDIGLPSYYLKRPSDTNECVIYNYIETPKLYGDNVELASKYTVLLNVYCKNKIETNKKNVIRAMLKNGFKKKIILQTILEENELYNTAMQFIIALKN
ncbi:hypothetical protein FDA25_02555 [Clostridium botulinum]|nr:hypothetical protein [Clostridium botulinum]NFH71495.1 hypothetical protein [Clostridium botulinum]NFI79798.1 hypothetical protein [Clostridium botulinum]NFJ70892.1 hypothetical protein [Clostridium botulinum]NFM10003.1 hypothetical protein [Clostridium botulinum]